MSRLALNLAIALLPPSRKAWGEAMKAEYAHLSDGQSGFTWGCIGASLKENVTTSEGWARIGFGLVLVLSLWLTLYWTRFILGSVDFTANISVRLIGGLAYLGFGLFPLVLGLAAYNSMKKPTHKLRLAQIGHKTVTRFLIILGGLLSFLSVLAIISNFEFSAKGEVVETGFLIGLAQGPTFLIAAWYARKSARMMRNAGTLALLLALACAGLSVVHSAAQPQGSGHNYAYSAIFVAFCMLLTAIGGAVFMWMERPSKSTHQA